MKNLEYIATNKVKLLDCLFEIMPSKSRTTVKSYLRNGQVSIGDMRCTQFDHEVNPGDRVVVSFEKVKEGLKHPLIRIVYEDEYLVVVNKNSGLLSIATDKEMNKTAYNIIRDYLRREDENAKVFVVHRLDRETSGLMVFAKDEQTKHDMQRNWEDVVTERKYVAVCEGEMEKKDGVIETYLTESKALKVYATTKEQGRVARTHLKVLKTSYRRNLSLVQLQLSTGRKNQIRAHLEYIGFPIIGDKKYGAKYLSPIGRVALHALSLCFIHPVTGEHLKFQTSMPVQFLKLF
ncbi:MAG: RluA family pseudouridine synthase [Rikenellaceae bacterium]